MGAFKYQRVRQRVAHSAPPIHYAHSAPPIHYAHSAPPIRRTHIQEISMKLGQVTKQPRETESYTLEYEADLNIGGELIGVTVSSVEPAGLIINPAFVVDSRVRFYARGGDDGVTYKTTFTVTTADGRILEDEVNIKVKEL
jgi:hypothetical protein